MLDKLNQTNEGIQMVKTKTIKKAGKATKKKTEPKQALSPVEEMERKFRLQKLKKLMFLQKT